MTDDITASGFQDESTFESVNSEFTHLEMLGTHGHNVLARAKRYGRWYLLKGLSPEHRGDEMYRQSLSKEFDIMMRLQHPAVVQAVSLEPVEELGTCIVMEWVEGSTLKKWLEGKTTRDERQHAAGQLIDALAHIHSHGIAHRDIKPSNIMITGNGNNVKIIDFGLADTDVHATLKHPAGTEQYMAPEQATTSKPDARNDIYSLGLVLREMDLGKHYKAPIARCLMPIADRYQSVDEMKNDLRRREARRRKIAIGLAAAGVAAALATTAFLAIYFSHKDPGTVYVTDDKARQQVDSLRSTLSQTTEQMRQSQEAQSTMQSHLGELNDTIASLNNANVRLRATEMEREARQKMVDDAIAEGLRLIDATNAATHVEQHVDTVSDIKYVWIDWHYWTIRGEKKIPEYMSSIRNRFTSKELAEIEYTLKEHCQNYENKIRQKLDKKGVFIVDEK